MFPSRKYKWKYDWYLDISSWVMHKNIYTNKEKYIYIFTLNRDWLIVLIKHETKKQ